MKDNLANRPKLADFDTGVPDELDPTCTKLNIYAWIKAEEEWFEAFKKELREQIIETEEENARILATVNEDQLLPDSNAHAIMRSSYFNNGQIMKIKEIVGEKP